MGVFDPDDFSDRPYVGGLNQLAHVVFGAALDGVVSFFVPAATVGFLIAATLYVGWETYQLKAKGAGIADYLADIAYWTVGAGLWAAFIASGQIQGVAVLLPCVPLLAWLAEFIRLGGVR